MMPVAKTNGGHVKGFRKSSMVKLCLVGLAALASCDADDRAHVQDCVDSRGIVVPEHFCDGKLPDAGSMTVEERTYYQTVIVPQGPRFIPYYQWHYDDVYVPIGNHIWGGSYAPSAEYSYTRGSTFTGSTPGAISASRGGFGSVGRSFSSGGGE